MDTHAHTHFSGMRAPRGVSYTIFCQKLRTKEKYCSEVALRKLVGSINGGNVNVYHEIAFVKFHHTILGGTVL